MSVVLSSEQFKTWSFDVTSRDRKFWHRLLSGFLTVTNLVHRYTSSSAINDIILQIEAVPFGMITG